MYKQRGGGGCWIRIHNAPVCVGLAVVVVNHPPSLSLYLLYELKQKSVWEEDEPMTHATDAFPTNQCCFPEDWSERVFLTQLSDLLWAEDGTAAATTCVHDHIIHIPVTLTMGLAVASFTLWKFCRVFLYQTNLGHRGTENFQPKTFSC